MPALFDDYGVRFQYPENWSVEENPTETGEEGVTVYSPGGAFWSVTTAPRHRNPAELVQAAVEALQSEYEGVEVEPVTETIEGYACTGCDLNFFYLDLTSTIQLRGIRVPGRTLLVHVQAEDREFEQLKLVFSAMTHSLLSECNRSAAS
jgi:hypothetical protein